MPGLTELTLFVCTCIGSTAEEFLRSLSIPLSAHPILISTSACVGRTRIGTRTWDGKDSEILIGQAHTPQSDREFIHSAIKYFKDPRYLRVAGKLMLVVYRVDLLPDCQGTAAFWREEVIKAGLGELHLCAVQFYGITDPRGYGFDAAVEFPPHGWLVPENKPESNPSNMSESFQGHVFDYTKSVDFALRKVPNPDYICYRTAFPGWDNTARRQDTSHIFSNSNFIEFERWLTSILRQTKLLLPQENQIVFINAWNEWAEGAHLEPDTKDGFLNLQAVNSSLETIRRERSILELIAEIKSCRNTELNAEEVLLNIFRGQERALKWLSSRLAEVEL